MIGDTLSQISSLASNERWLVLHLVLTTLAGEELQMVIDLQEFDRLDEFETAVLENLPFIGGHSAFGCELVFVNKDTRAILADPIWDTLRDSNCFNLVVRQCLIQVEHKGQLKNRAKAIRVPSTRTGRVLPHAFTHTVDLRHVQSRGRNTYHRRSCLAALQQITNSAATKYGSLSARWGLSQELCTPHCHSPRMQIFWSLGI